MDHFKITYLSLHKYCATTEILIQRVRFIGCTNLNVAHPPNGKVDLVFRVMASRRNVDCITVIRYRLN